MHAFSNFARQTMAALGALAITAGLLVGSFSADPQVQAMVGIVA